MGVHQLKTQELREWHLEQRVMFAMSTKEEKRLYATLSGGFEVWHNDKVILETLQQFEAVKIYNSINSKEWELQKNTH